MQEWTLSNQTSGYKSKCIRIHNLHDQIKLSTLVHFLVSFTIDIKYRLCPCKELHVNCFVF